VVARVPMVQLPPGMPVVLQMQVPM
jgi:hypothetical protein